MDRAHFVLISYDQGRSPVWIPFRTGDAAVRYIPDKFPNAVRSNDHARSDEPGAVVYRDDELGRWIEYIDLPYTEDL